LAAKSLLLTGLALGAASQTAQAQYVVESTSESQSISAGQVAVVGGVNAGEGGSSSSALSNMAKINLPSTQDLIGVTFAYSGGISQSCRVQVAGGLNSGSATISFNDTLSLSANSGLFTVSPVTSYNLQNSGSWNGATGHSNSFNYSGNTSASGGSQTGTLVNPQSPGLGGFVGTGSLGMTLNLQDNSHEYNHGSSQSNFSASNLAGSVSLTYTYLVGSDTGGLLTNGSFELPAQIETNTVNGSIASGDNFAYGYQSASTGFSVAASTVNAIPNLGWSFNGTSGIVQSGGNSQLGLSNAGTGGSDGDQTAFIEETGDISQNVTISKAGVYKISFVAEQRPGDTQDFEVVVGGQVLDATANIYNSVLVGSQAGYDPNSGDILPPNYNSWNTYTLYTQRLTPGSYLVDLVGLDQAQDDDFAFIDSVNMQYGYGSVPAPSSLIVLGSGMPLLLMVRRRRKARRVA
jgi:hypothetical protein